MSDELTAATQGLTDFSGNPVPPPSSEPSTPEEPASSSASSSRHRPSRKMSSKSVLTLVAIAVLIIGTAVTMTLFGKGADIRQHASEALCNGGDRVSCTSVTGCKWKTDTTACSTVAVANCGSTPGCTVKPNATCNAISDLNHCPTTAGCSVKTSFGNCNTITDQTSCLKVEGCSFVGGQCSGSYVASKHCEGASTCEGNYAAGGHCEGNAVTSGGGSTTGDIPPKSSIAPAPTAPFIPDCTGIAIANGDPGSLQVGKTYTINVTAGGFAPITQVWASVHKTTDCTVINPYNRVNTTSKGVQQIAWTPAAAGSYVIAGRIWNDGVAEGRADCVDNAPRFLMEHANACKLTVTVKSDRPVPPPAPVYPGCKSLTGGGYANNNGTLWHAVVVQGRSPVSKVAAFYRAEPTPANSCAVASTNPWIALPTPVKSGDGYDVYLPTSAQQTMKYIKYQMVVNVTAADGTSCTGNPGCTGADGSSCSNCSNYPGVSCHNCMTTFMGPAAP